MGKIKREFIVYELYFLKENNEIETYDYMTEISDKVCYLVEHAKNLIDIYARHEALSINKRNTSNAPRKVFVIASIEIPKRL